VVSIYTTSMTENKRYWLTLTASLVVAYVGRFAPSYRMPLDYDATISTSIPLAIIWAVLLGFCLWRYKQRGLWLLLGTPMALYWPIWLLFNHFPPCYYSRNCQ
jgi:hypothetical protein